MRKFLAVAVGTALLALAGATTAQAQWGGYNGAYNSAAAAGGVRFTTSGANGVTRGAVGYAGGATAGYGGAAAGGVKGGYAYHTSSGGAAGGYAVGGYRAAGAAGGYRAGASRRW